MGAMITIEPCEVKVIRHQCTHLGYVLCGNCINVTKAGTLHELTESDAMRAAETDDRGLWTCDACGKYVTDWPRVVLTVNAVVEHPTCRIY